MQSLDLNLATRPFRNNTLLWLGYGLAVALLAAFTIWNVNTYREYHGWVADLEQTSGDFETQKVELDRRDTRARLGIERYDLPSLEVQAHKANEVIRWKSFSWTRLFNLLEGIQPWEVRMTSIHPVFRAERARARNDAVLDDDSVPVSVEGVAKDLKAFLEFERKLIYDPHFDRVQPDRTGKDNVTGETVFSLRFVYDPTASDVEEMQVETAEADTDEAGSREPTAGAGAADAGEAAAGEGAGDELAEGEVPGSPRSAAPSGIGAIAADRRAPPAGTAAARPDRRRADPRQPRQPTAREPAAQGPTARGSQ